jgi:hypothetical protein
MSVFIYIKKKIIDQISEYPQEKQKDVQNEEYKEYL